MNNKKIGLIAGTIVDTKMGVEILEDKKIETSGYPLSKDCNEQNKLQFLDRKSLRELTLEKLLDAKEDGYEDILIYCNSLSASLDFKSLAKETELNIKTPFDAYEEISEGIENLLIISANSNSLNMQERSLKEFNKDIEFVTVGVLTYVDYIEKGIDADLICKEYGLENLIEFYENIPLEGKKSILLGCTHFPYLKPSMEKITDIEVIDPMGILISLF